MADRGFTIDEELKVNLNIPAFLGGRIHSTKTEVKESQTIALVRIHAERAISRIKKNSNYSKWNPVDFSRWFK